MGTGARVRRRLLRRDAAYSTHTWRSLDRRCLRKGSAGRAAHGEPAGVGARVRDSNDAPPDIVTSRSTARSAVKSDLRRFVTLFYALYDSTRRVLPARTPVTILRLVLPTGLRERRPHGRHRAGIFDEGTYSKARSCSSQAIDSVLFTDGITEARSERARIRRRPSGANAGSMPPSRRAVDGRCDLQRRRRLCRRLFRTMRPRWWRPSRRDRLRARAKANSHVPQADRR